MSDQELRRVMHPPNHVPYLIAIVIMILIAIAAIVLVAVLRPDKDNMPLYVLIIGSIGPTTLALLGFMKSQETHLSVNSRLDQFIANADRSARAEGELAGRAAQVETVTAAATEVQAAVAAALKQERVHGWVDAAKIVMPKVSVPEKGVDKAKSNLEIAVALVSPAGGEPMRVENVAATISPEERPQK